MDIEETVLALLSLEGIGPRWVERAIETAQPESFLDFFDYANFLRDKDIKVPRLTREKADAATQGAKVCLDLCKEKNITFLHRWASLFPQQLKHIPKAPVILFAMGYVDALSMAGVAVIGTRNPTEYGIKSAKRIAQRAVKKSLSVISGLAEGCDTGGHLGALDANGVTIAVLAQGLGTSIYPAVNRPLATRISENKGCLLSEYLPWEQAHPSKFVARDRLQSALAKGTIVIETDIKGGTMHTVDSTIEQGRLLAAVMHPENLRNEPQSQGNQKMVAEGKAFGLATSDDLMAFLDKVIGSPVTTTPILKKTTSRHKENPNQTTML